MKSQFHALLREAIAARRTGALSGTAIADDPQSGLAQRQGKGFSWLMRRGELVASEFDGLGALPAALRLLKAQQVIKVRWFSMGVDSVGDSEPLLPVQQILLLIDGTSALAKANPTVTNTADTNALQRLALGVFTEFFGEDAQDVLSRITASLGPDASASSLAKACAKALEPLLGESMARSYFQKFI